MSKNRDSIERLRTASSINNVAPSDSQTYSSNKIESELLERDNSISDTVHKAGSEVVTGQKSFTGGAIVTGLRETKVSMAANNIDLALGNVFTKTISGSTTFTVSNVLASGNANSFILELTNGGAYAITWFSGIKWAGGTVPTLTASGVDILGFYSHDGGTTWRGMVLAKDSK